ncbi:MAG: DNA repair protein RecO [Crocinitomicaceae bacterium]|nr:DNA repair protein RecO [Crocinitomicaceae bacterium]
MSIRTVEGIVLYKTDYSESSLIIKALTKDEGVQSFIFQGAKRKNKNGNLVSPLSILSISYYQRSDSQLAKISAIESSVIYRSIPFDPYKSSVLFFVNEVLNKVIKEKESDQELFTFVRSILEILDLSDRTANFPIKFLFQLTKYLGFYPQFDIEGKYFDLQEGKFTKNIPNHPFYLDEQKSDILKQVAKMQFDGIEDLQIPLDIRRELIKDLIQYYKVIIDNFQDLKSLSILEATLHD